MIMMIYCYYYMIIIDDSVWDVYETITYNIQITNLNIINTISYISVLGFIL